MEVALEPDALAPGLGRGDLQNVVRIVRGIGDKTVPDETLQRLGIVVSVVARTLPHIIDAEVDIELFAKSDRARLRSELI